MKEDKKFGRSENVQAAMRSLYRFSELKSLGSPDIIVDNEKNILRRYLSEMTAEEVLYLARNFNKYYEQEKIQNALDDEQLAGDFDRYITNLN